MDLLVKWLGPASTEHANRLRTAYLNCPEKGLQEIWKCLEKCYGSPEAIKDSLFERIHRFPRVTRDYDRLRELSDLLTELQAAKDDGDLPGLALLDTARGLRPIVEKLPPTLRDQWTSHGTAYKRKHQVPFPPFSVFTKFIEQQAEDRNDASFRLTTDTWPSQNMDRATTPHRTEISVHKTQIASKEIKEICTIHNLPHPLRSYWAFRGKPFPERQAYLRQHNICFRCCSTHVNKDCRFKPKCAECGSESHNTALHPGPVPQTTPIRAMPNHGGENNDVTAHCTQVCGSNLIDKSCSKICLVMVHPQGQRNKAVRMYAVIDEHSNKSLARPEFFELFSDFIPTSSYSLRTCAGVIEMEDDRLAYSIEDRIFLDIMEKGVRKNSHCSWVAPLPLKPSRLRLPNNRQQAVSRLNSLTRQFRRKPRLAKDFFSFMEKIFADARAEVAPPLKQEEERWYLPMFGIYHPKKTNKIRVVFDSSAQYNGVSLNDALLTGPDLNNNLIGVLIRFRKEPVAIMADVEQMFYCFLVKREHRDFLRFLWYKDNDPDKEIVEYRMKVHVFGNSPSPAVATYCLRKSVGGTHPECSPAVVQYVHRDFYVDDGLKSVPTVGEAISLLKETRNVLAASNLRLHKIASNKKEVLDAFPTGDLASDIKDWTSMKRLYRCNVAWDLIGTQRVTASHFELQMKRSLIHAEASCQQSTASMTLLGSWLQLPSKASPFYGNSHPISNRVLRIRRSSQPEQWHYVPTDKNPADCGTRSIPANQMSTTAWLNSRSFLSNSLFNRFESNSYCLINPENDVEIRPVVTTFTTHSSPVLLGAHRFRKLSTWAALTRAIARLIHISQSFKKETRPKDCKGWHYCRAPFPVETLAQSNDVILGLAQRDTHHHKQVHHQGRHFTEGAVRAAGLSVEKKYQQNHPLLRNLQKAPWTYAGQRMADLPEDRLSMEPPFTNVGLDVFGS
ncbi:unnamed protein product [Acanthosepion pharaonis]|uniref:Uncharacterized protein n=1 Tax=Acanthosepion pharaonis TaxID=158019 RepID=A0A812DRA2_ACAPH|nr:unnamed protein product [Sepia pharaonis]